MKNDDLGKKLMEMHKKYTNHDPRYQNENVWCSKCMYGVYDMHDFDSFIELEEAKQIWPMLKKPK